MVDESKADESAAEEKAAEPDLGPMWPPLAVAAVAILAGTPLFVRDLAALGGNRFDPCLPVFGTECPPHEDPVDKLVAGIPLSGLGMIYSVTVVLALLPGTAFGRSAARSIRHFLFLLALPAAAISVYLLFLLISGLAHGCPYCFTGNVCSLLQVAALGWSIGGPGKTVLARNRAWIRRIVLGRTDGVGETDPPTERLAAVASLLLFVALFAIVRVLTLSRLLAGA